MNPRRGKRRIAKPDDYYRKGSIEVARFGKEVVMRNNMSAEAHSKSFERLTDSYPVIKQEIDHLIADIRGRYIHRSYPTLQQDVRNSSE
jgi:hypothetical protein